MSPQSRTEIIGEDGLSRLVRTYLSDDGRSLVSVKKETQQILQELQKYIIGRGWPDPMGVVVYRDRDKQIKALDDIRDIYDIGVGAATGVMGWKVIREKLQRDGSTFSPDWYAAKLIGLGLQILTERGSARDHALRAFGYDWRDMQWRLGYGEKARTRIEQESVLAMDRGGGRAAANTKRAKVAAKWKVKARQEADEVRRKRPNLRDNGVGQIIHQRWLKRERELEQEVRRAHSDLGEMALAEEIRERKAAEGIVTHKGSVPEARTIRGAIA